MDEGILQGGWRTHSQEFSGASDNFVNRPMDFQDDLLFSLLFEQGRSQRGQGLSQSNCFRFLD